MSKIAEILNEAETPAPNGGLWGASSIEAILKNPVYTGDLTWNIRKHNKEKTYEFKGIHEPIVDSFLIHLNENNVKLQSEFGRLDTPFLFLNLLHCGECNELLKTQNASTTRNGKKYCYQYYVCKTCNYKLDISSTHETILPVILKHVQSLTSHNTVKNSTEAFLTALQETTKEKIMNLEKHIDNLESKGCIAKEQEDEDFEQIINDLLIEYQSDLKCLTRSLCIQSELLGAVNSDLYFSRFNHVLEQQLSQQEQRLITLYFVNEILVSPDQAPQIVFRSNAFENFYPIQVGQSTETD